MHTVLFCFLSKFCRSAMLSRKLQVSFTAQKDASPQPKLVTRRGEDIQRVNLQSPFSLGSHEGPLKVQQDGAEHGGRNAGGNVGQGFEVYSAKPDVETNVTWLSGRHVPWGGGDWDTYQLLYLISPSFSNFLQPGLKFGPVLQSFLPGALWFSTVSWNVLTLNAGCMCMHAAL